MRLVICTRTAFLVVGHNDGPEFHDDQLVGMNTKYAV